MSNDMCVTDIAAHLYLVFIYAGLMLVFFDLCQVVFWPFIQKSLKKEKEVKEEEEEAQEEEEADPPKTPAEQSRRLILEMEEQRQINSDDSDSEPRSSDPLQVSIQSS